MNTGLNTIPKVSGYIIPLSLNLIIVGIFCVFAGLATSSVFSHFIPNFDDRWKNSSTIYQLTDISLEIIGITLTAFWVTYIIHMYIPVFKVSTGLEGYIESFGGQMLFVYTLFLMIDTLDDKLKFIANKISSLI
jgi:hypothetical protein